MSKDLGVGAGAPPLAQKHTPGPWEWVDSPAWGYSTLWNPETRQEVLVPGARSDFERPEVWMGEEMSDADKALIAASPRFLAALLKIAERDGDGLPSLTDGAMCAIAEAALKQEGGRS